jgi:hypothetical protein
MSELDQTIEELEAEVLAELEEAEDPTKQGAAPAEKSKMKNDAEDTGKPVVDPEQKDAPAKKVAAKAKEISGDPAQKGEVAPQKPEKLAASHVPEEGEELEEAKMTKEMMKKEMSHKMEGMKAVDLKAAYEAMMKDGYHEDADEVEEEISAEKKEEIDARIKDLDVKEDVDALMSGEDLSEEFKTKAGTVFEAAIKSKLRSEIDRIHEEVKSEKETEMETFKEDLTEKVDTYLNYVVEEWTKENELAIERGLKGEIAEDFISGLKQLFEDHYIDVPDEKYDVLEAQSEKIAELEEKINEEIQRNVSIAQQNSGLVREQVIAQVSDDLAQTEIEKFKGLVEDVDFTDEESFHEKLSTLKESYFPKVKPAAGTRAIDDEDGGTAQDIDTTDTMHKYMSAISRDQKASA